MHSGVSSPTSLIGAGSTLSRRRFLSLAGGSGLAFAGGLFGAHGVEGANEVVFVVGESFDLDSLDPARSFGVTSYMTSYANYDTLVTFYGEDLRTIKPSLAKEWKRSADGKQYTFTLRPNVQFSSGRTLTAADAIWSINRVRNMKGIGEFFFDAWDQITAPDPLTVVITLTHPKPSVLPILTNPSLCVLDSALVMQNGGDAGPDAKDKDKAETYLNAHSVGTGAFTLSSYTPNHEIVLIKNPNHWRGPAKLDRIVIRSIAEPSSQQLQLAKRDIDIAMGIGPSQADALRKESGVTVKASPTASTYWLQLNNDPALGGAFANPKVQEAVRYALDYDGILEIAGPGAIRLAGLLMPLFPGALDSKDAIKTDRTKAQSLLKAAGLATVEGKLSYPSGRLFLGVDVDALAQKIQRDLTTVGIKIALDGNTLPATRDLARSGKFQVLIWTWSADYPDQDDFLPFLPGGLLGKRSHWTEDSSTEAREVVKLGGQAPTELDAQKRTALYKRIDQLLQEAGPYVPLFVPAAPYAYRSYVHGATDNSIWELDLFAISKTP